MLWYLHLCADAGVVVVSYEDRAEGTMRETTEGGGRFVNVTLRPHVVVRGSVAQAEALHQRAHELCFIANSVNFPVEIESVTELASFYRRTVPVCYSEKSKRSLPRHCGVKFSELRYPKLLN